ncbi:HAD family hydrolase [Candidatus Gracilibacteria bacterium]|nr:HAD family hydrolase [Candidatus Gracilibacteria bacterium]
MILFIFDFDNTLGDAYGPYGEGNIFRTKTLPDVARATEIYEKYRRGHDDIVVYPKLLEEYGITNPHDFFINAGIPNQLYDDVVPFFIKLREYPEVASVILTTGDEEFQKLKTHITGVDSLVGEVYITRERNKIKHIKHLIEKYKPESTIFVDDRINLTESHFDIPITIYEMDRAHEKNGTHIIHSLDELPLEKLLGIK